MGCGEDDAVKVKLPGDSGTVSVPETVRELAVEEDDGDAVRVGAVAVVVAVAVGWVRDGDEKDRVADPDGPERVGVGLVRVGDGDGVALRVAVGVQVGARVPDVVADAVAVEGEAERETVPEGGEPVRERVGGVCVAEAVVKVADGLPEAVREGLLERVQVREAVVRERVPVGLALSDRESVGDGVRVPVGLPVAVVVGVRVAEREHVGVRLATAVPVGLRVGGDRVAEPLAVAEAVVAVCDCEPRLQVAEAVSDWLKLRVWEAVHVAVGW